MIEWWWLLITGLGTLILGLSIGFVATKWFFKRQLKQNPPINAGMIRAMYRQMGRKPSEVQVRSVINAMKRHQN